MICLKLKFVAPRDRPMQKYFLLVSLQKECDEWLTRLLVLRFQGGVSQARVSDKCDQIGSISTKCYHLSYLVMLCVSELLIHLFDLLQTTVALGQLVSQPYL